MMKATFKSIAFLVLAMSLLTACKPVATPEPEAEPEAEVTELVPENEYQGELQPNVTVSGNADIIKLDYSSLEGGITSPLVIRGEARGGWYFEASFPVVLTNWDGLIIAQSHAEAQGEWMTQDYVPFVSTIVFDKPEYGERGSLILQKDNPSGEYQYDDALETTIFFK